MSIAEFIQWLRSGRLGPCATGVGRAAITDWLGEPGVLGYDRRRRQSDDNLLVFCDMSFQVTLREKRVVSYGLYFRRPSGAKFFSELGSEDSLRVDHSSTKTDITRILCDADIVFRDFGERLELDSGVAVIFGDDGRLDSIQVSSPKVRSVPFDGKRS